MRSSEINLGTNGVDQGVLRLTILIFGNFVSGWLTSLNLPFLRRVRGGGGLYGTLFTAFLLM